MSLLSRNANRIGLFITNPVLKRSTPERLVTHVKLLYLPAHAAMFTFHCLSQFAGPVVCLAGYGVRFANTEHNTRGVHGLSIVAAPATDYVLYKRENNLGHVTQTSNICLQNDEHKVTN